MAADEAKRLLDWLRESRVNAVPVLDTFFPDKRLAALAGQLGIEFPGHRLAKVPRTELLDAVADTAGQDPVAGERVVQEILKMVAEEVEQVRSLDARDLAAWIEGASSTSQGLRRLVAAIADPRPQVGRAARKWWRAFLRELRRDVAPEPEGRGSPPTGQEFVQITGALERGVREIREAVRVLRESFHHVTQHLERATADLDRRVRTVGEDLTRLRSWFGEQHASVRRAVEELSSSVHAIEVRLDRMQSAVENLVARVAAAGVALERGHLEQARRVLIRLRSSRPRVGLFADVANLYLSARDAHGARVHYGALLERARALGEVVVARAYVTEGEEVHRTAAFEAALRHAGFEVRTIRVRRLPDGSYKANWDLGMATDVLRYADDLDVVVLATGDGDFVELVRWLRERGLQVHAAGVPGHTAGELITSCDGWIPIEGDLLLMTRP